MKIKKIEGENFKGHENLELNLADKKIQVFVGKNGVGKSSAIEMIQYAITGVTPLEPINNKYNYMSVYTELESGDVYTESIEKWNVNDSIIGIYQPYLNKLDEVLTPNGLLQFILN